MNREIKFRVWNPRLKCMSECFNPIKQEMPIFSGNLVYTAWLPDTDDIMQYTGLKDRKGKEIYEGDIMTDTYRVNPIEVRFKTEEVGSCGCCYPNFVGSGFVALGIDLTDCEVIGNRFENPELLKP